MTGFSIAINAWGIHTVLHKTLSAAETDLWVAQLREAAGCRGASARNWGVVADIRGLDLHGLGGVALLPVLASELFGVVGRQDVERCAVIAADQDQAELFGRLTAGSDGAGKTRIVALAGRDRLQIAAAYGWVLNGSEPRLAHQLSSATVLPFRKTGSTGRHSASNRALRQAS